MVKVLDHPDESTFQVSISWELETANSSTVAISVKNKLFFGILNYSLQQMVIDELNIVAGQTGNTESTGQAVAWLESTNL